MKIDEKNILKFLFELGFIERTYESLDSWEKPSKYESYKNGEMKYLRYENKNFECNIEVHFCHNEICFYFTPKDNIPIIERIKFMGYGNYYRFMPNYNEPFSYSNYLDDYQRIELMFNFYFKTELRQYKIKNVLNGN